MAVELFMPIILDRLIDVTTQQIGEKVNLIAGVEEEVDSLKKKFDTLAYVLEDAERRKIKESPIWAWLEQLEDIAYEMEDVLEEWHIKFIKPQQVRAKSTTRMPTTLLDKVHSLIQSLCSCVNQLPGRNDIALKIREINRKLGAALEEANNFSFVVGRTFSGLDSKACKARVSTSIIDISQVQGWCSWKHNLSDDEKGERGESSRHRLLAYVRPAYKV
ncbi:OLC1v1008961C1 [Oldenlandia corymbosa var. corymbosa]|uniref:OLC1v1008961C1 n=1 Tax=Oldenlandia corymbosa var. corymbosa TaxID=529605 RepID=A0AAV1DQ79_OLDCO|nr:OLC1v1008961C1 [Oldenlandia corymbosa var. corymbosa]